MSGPTRNPLIRAFSFIALMLPLAHQGSAQSPLTRTLVCTRNGHEIGSETISINHSPTEIAVKMAIHIKVKMLGVSVYRFEQTTSETWAGDRWVDLTSETTDNGKPHSLHVRRDGLSLKMNADGKDSVIDSAALPSTLWYEPKFEEAMLVKNVDGQISCQGSKTRRRKNKDQRRHGGQHTLPFFRKPRV